MPIIFETKPKYRSVNVEGVEIPLYGDVTVDEAIAVEKALINEADQSAPSNTEYAIIQVSAWLSARLGVDRESITAQLKRSKKLVDKLWEVYYAERESNTNDYELDEEVAEGKEESGEQLKMSKKSGTAST